MTSDYRNISKRTISDAKNVNHSLIEKALAMRCISYLAQVKSQLLTDTIYEIDSSKKSLFQLNTQLRQEIEERRRIEQQLIEAKNEAEEATRLKDRFVALVSHDLKNPIGVVMGYLQILHATQEFPDEVKDMLDHAIDACFCMAELVDEILSMSRIVNGKIEPERSIIDMNNIVSNVVKRYQIMAKEKGVALENEVPNNMIINADAKLLSEVIGNLISNALKFCQQGDSVRIFLEDGETLTLNVVDTGVGIEPEYLPHLFEFDEKTTTSGTCGEPGTGLGLPLAKLIVSAHDGELIATSEKGQGTTMQIKLPQSIMVEKTLNQ